MAYGKMEVIKVLKFSVSTIGISILLFVGFYFWASSSNYLEKDYSQLTRNDYHCSIDEDSVYSIITYNIGYLSGMANNRPLPKDQALFDENLKSVKFKLQNINADILCFQEIDYNSHRSFYVNQENEIEKLGYNHVFRAVNWDVNYLPFPGYWMPYHHGRILSGQSILSKYPLMDTERILLERVENSPFYRKAFYLERMAQVSKVNIDGRTVVLINVHLEAFDAVTRRKQTEYIIELYYKYQSTYPVLLVGDFNSDSNFTKAAIKSLLSTSGIGCASYTQENKGKTFPSAQPTDRLDYIFYNKEFIELKDSKILTSFGQASDHLPVMMTFTLK